MRIGAQWNVNAIIVGQADNVRWTVTMVEQGKDELGNAFGSLHIEREIDRVMRAFDDRRMDAFDD